MFANWKPKLATFGAFLLAVITWLGFFEISARTLRQQMSAHYLFLIAAVICTGLFALALRYWWRNSRTTPGNIQSRIREWLDGAGYPHAVAPWPGVWHFGFRVTMDRGPLLFVARPVVRDSYLLLSGRLQGIADRHREAFNKLSKSERDEFYARLNLEVARTKIAFFPDASLNQVSIIKWIPITSKLTESVFVDGIGEIFFSAHVIWTTIALQFGERPEQLTPPPESIPDTEASQPEQA